METVDDKVEQVEDKVKHVDKPKSFDDGFKSYTISETPFRSEIMRIDTAVVMKTSPRCHGGEFAAMKYVAEHLPQYPSRLRTLLNGASQADAAQL